MMEQCNTWKCKPAYCYKWKNDENRMQHILGVLMKATRSVRRKVRQHENSASQDGERRRPCSGPLGGDPFRDNYELAHINVYKCIDWKTLKFLRLWDRRKNVLFCGNRSPSLHRETSLPKKHFRLSTTCRTIAKRMPCTCSKCAHTSVQKVTGPHWAG